MDTAQSNKGKEVAHSTESLSQDSVSVKRSREAVTEVIASADVEEQQNPHAFWKIRDAKGWEHGIKIDENNSQHWKCKYCSYIGHSGGVTKLKHHLVGSGDLKKCPSVPDHVSIEIKHLIDMKREKRAKRAAQKGGSSMNSGGADDDGSQQAVSNISESKELMRLDTLIILPSQDYLIQLSQVPDVTSNISDVQKELTCSHPGKEAKDESMYSESCNSMFKEPTEGSMVLVQQDQANPTACKDLEAWGPPDPEESAIKEAVDNLRALRLHSSTQQHTQVPGSSSVAASAECCKICTGPEMEGKRFIVCGNSLCPYRNYHFGCMTVKQVISGAQFDKPWWYCPSCLCRACMVDRDDDMTILCDDCDEAYHIYCLKPPLTSVPNGDWFCSSCSVERAKVSAEHEQRMLELHRKYGGHMMRLVDMMLAASVDQS